MNSPGPARQAVEQLIEISHLPPSMNGNPFLYFTTLTAVMCGAVLGMYVVAWMGYDILRDRNRMGFKSILFNFRLMMGLTGLGAVFACLPEVLYLQMYNDPVVSDAIKAAVTTGKRVADSTRIFVTLGWVSVLVVIYPYICLALMEAEKDEIIKYLQIEDHPGLHRLIKPAIVFAILALIAMVFSFSKVYGL